MNFYFSKLDLAGMWGGRKKTHFRFSLWRKNVCAMAQKCVLDRPSGYEKKFFFLVVYILVLCLKGIFAAFVLLCIQAFGSLWGFFELNIISGSLGCVCQWYLGFLCPTCASAEWKGLGTSLNWFYFLHSLVGVSAEHQQENPPSSHHTSIRASRNENKGDCSRRQEQS